MDLQSLLAILQSAGYLTDTQATTPDQAWHALQAQDRNQILGALPADLPRERIQEFAHWLSENDGGLRQSLASRLAGPSPLGAPSVPPGDSINIPIVMREKYVLTTGAPGLLVVETRPDFVRFEITFPEEEMQRILTLYRSASTLPAHEKYPVSAPFQSEEEVRLAMMADLWMAYQSEHGENKPAQMPPGWIRWFLCIFFPVMTKIIQKHPLNKLISPPWMPLFDDMRVVLGTMNQSSKTPLSDELQAFPLVRQMLQKPHSLLGTNESRTILAVSAHAIISREESRKMTLHWENSRGDHFCNLDTDLEPAEMLLFLSSPEQFIESSPINLKIYTLREGKLFVTERHTDAIPLLEGGPEETLLGSLIGEIPDASSMDEPPRDSQILPPLIRKCQVQADFLRKKGFGLIPLPSNKFIFLVNAPNGMTVVIEEVDSGLIYHRIDYVFSKMEISEWIESQNSLGDLIGSKKHMANGNIGGSHFNLDQSGFAWGSETLSRVTQRNPEYVGWLLEHDYHFLGSTETKAAFFHFSGKTIILLGGSADSIVVIPRAMRREELSHLPTFTMTAPEMPQTDVPALAPVVKLDSSSVAIQKTKNSWSDLVSYLHAKLNPGSGDAAELETRFVSSQAQAVRALEKMEVSPSEPLRLAFQAFLNDAELKNTDQLPGHLQPFISGDVLLSSSELPLAQALFATAQLQQVEIIERYQALCRFQMPLAWAATREIMTLKAYPPSNQDWFNYFSWHRSPPETVQKILSPAELVLKQYWHLRFGRMFYFLTKSEERAKYMYTAERLTDLEQYLPVLETLHGERRITAEELQDAHNFRTRLATYVQSGTKLTLFPEEKPTGGDKGSGSAVPARGGAPIPAPMATLEGAQIRPAGDAILEVADLNEDRRPPDDLKPRTHATPYIFRGGKLFRASPIRAVRAQNLLLRRG